MSATRLATRLHVAAGLGTSRHVQHLSCLPDSATSRFCHRAVGHLESHFHPRLSQAALWDTMLRLLTGISAPEGSQDTGKGPSLSLGGPSLKRKLHARVGSLSTSAAASVGLFSREGPLHRLRKALIAMVRSAYFWLNPTPRMTNDPHFCPPAHTASAALRAAGAALLDRASRRCLHGE